MPAGCVLFGLCCWRDANSIKNQGEPLSPPKKKPPVTNDFRRNSDKVHHRGVAQLRQDRSRAHALNHGVDLVKQTDVFLEFGEGAAEAWLETDSEPDVGSKAWSKVWIKASTAFESRPDYSPHTCSRQWPSTVHAVRVPVFPEELRGWCRKKFSDNDTRVSSFPSPRDRVKHFSNFNSESESASAENYCNLTPR